MKATDPKSEALKQSLGVLFNNSLKVSSPIQMLHCMREKIDNRGYYSHDTQDILGELGRLQNIVNQLHSDMLKVHDILKDR